MSHLVDHDRDIGIGLTKSVEVTVVPADSIILEEDSQGIDLTAKNLRQ